MITAITVPGIGEPLSPNGAPKGMLENLTRYLNPDLFVCKQFNYRNQYGPVPTWSGTAYDINLHNAVSGLAAMIGREPNVVVLIGYSAGAQVVSQLLTSIHAGLYPELEVDAAVLVANPVQRREEAPPTPRPVYGIAGEHGPWPENIRVFNLANPADIIPCAEEHSPIRGLSNISRTFSFSNPWHWIGEYLSSARAGKNQNWWNPFVSFAWERAVRGGIGYLNQSQHIHWYLDSNRLGALAQALNDYAENHQ